MLTDANHQLTDGFFDAGMLFQALKARGSTTEEETKASERAAANAKKRDVGKKLRLVTE
jgi:carnitine O-acetyltransferase